MIRFLMCLIMILFACTTGHAQAPACESTDCTEWIDVSGGVSMALITYNPDCGIAAKAKTRVCNGVREFYLYDIVKLNDGCSGFDEKTVNHHNFSGFNDYVTNAFMSSTYISSYFGTIPHCSTAARQQVANVYTASCGVWIACEYPVDPQTAECPAVWEGDPPHFGTNPTKVKVWKWQSCGTTCCKRVFELCTFGSTLQFMGIKQVSKGAMQPCSLQPLYSPDWNCEDGC